MGQNATSLVVVTLARIFISIERYDVFSNAGLYGQYRVGHTGGACAKVQEVVSVLLGTLS